MPVIPALWEAEEADHLRSRVRDQPGQLDETLSLLIHTGFYHDGQGALFTDIIHSVHTNRQKKTQSLGGAL